MTNFVNFITDRIDINEDDLNVIISSFERRVLPKDKLVIQKGQIVTHYYFIESGGFIIYSIENDVQHTRYFAFENELIADISKIKKRERSREYIRTLEETTVYTISSDKMESLYDRFPKWQKFGRLLWEESFSSVLESIHRFQSQTAKERYIGLLQRSDLINRVPLKDLSPFLGITPSSLSRIRKELSTST